MVARTGIGRAGGLGRSTQDQGKETHQFIEKTMGSSSWLLTFPSTEVDEVGVQAGAGGVFVKTLRRHGCFSFWAGRAWVCAQVGNLLGWFDGSTMRAESARLPKLS